jgi:predicted ATP-dependent endonuclease of OLD family
MALLLSLYKYVERLDRNSLVILFEEPETALHPSLQKEIPSILDSLINAATNKKKELQFIVTTHSPFIISAAESFENRSRVYLIENGKTTNLGRTDEHNEGYSPKYSLNVASQLLGAGLEDINSTIDTREDFNLFYCEGGNDSEGSKSFKDSDFYSSLFPEFNNKRNIFVSCGGSKHVKNAYYIGKNSAKFILGKDSHVYAIFDRSNSSDTYLALSDGTELKTDSEKHVYTETERSQYLIENPDHRILNRKEIENYLYDPVVVEKANNEGIFSEEKENVVKECIEILKSIESFDGEIKDLVQSDPKTGFLKKHHFELTNILNSIDELKEEIKNSIIPSSS